MAAGANPTVIYWLKYGVAATIPLAIENYNGNFIVTAGGSAWTPVAGDVTISKSGAAQANTTNLPASAANNAKQLTLALTAAELTCSSAHIIISKASTVIDTSIIIFTFGDASAWFAHDYSLSNVIASSSPTSYGAVAEVDYTLYLSSAAPSMTWTCLDSASAAIDLTGKTVTLTVLKADGSTLFTRVTGGGEMTISGAGNNIVTATYTAANTATAGDYRYKLRITTGGSERLLALGDLKIVDASVIS